MASIMSVFGRKHNAMLRRETRKLLVEMSRCRYYKRQHLPVKFKLENARWDRRAKVRLAQKKFRKG